jgi:hypothetical protein
MSIPVELNALADAIGRHGAVAYLLTSSDDGRPHISHTAVTMEEGGTLRTGGGRRTARNIAARPLVALLWPPFEDGGYSLIVDADAVVAPGVEGADDTVVLTPTRAVLHRPAPVDKNAPGTGSANDCQPLLD